MSDVDIPNLIVLSNVVAGVASASGADVSGFENCKALQVHLDVTAVTGTTPTLDLEVQVKIDGKYTRLLTFSQVTAVISVCRNAKRTLSVLGAELAFGVDPSIVPAGGAANLEWSDILRVKYTITGTTPSFTFTVKVLLVNY